MDKIEVESDAADVDVGDADADADAVGDADAVVGDVDVMEYFVAAIQSLQKAQNLDAEKLPKMGDG